MAGAEGIEPPLSALEALVIPFDHAPVGYSIANYSVLATLFLSFFLMELMFAAEFAETGAFQLLAVEALEVALGVVVIVLAHRALEADKVIL